MRQANNNVNSSRDNQKGAVAVEMAIALPLFAILLLGTLELGLMARDHQILQNAAREGARFSALPQNRIDGEQSPGAAEQTIKDRVIAYLQNEGISVGAGDIDLDQEFPVTIGSLTVDASRVTITYTRSASLSGAGDLFGLTSIVLNGDAVFRNFY